MKRLLIILVSLIIAFNYADSKTLYVSNDGSDGDGLSWQTALTNLQTAIDIADSCDQIWVKKGTYYPSRIINGSSKRNKSFVLKNGVKLYGGFLGNETNLSMARPDLYHSNLSGNINDTLLNTDNCYNIIYNSENQKIDSTTVLHGFWIIDSYSDNSDFNEYAAPIYNNHASPKIVKCRFKNNVSNIAGAIYSLNSNPIIDSCVFLMNTVNNSAIVYNHISNSTISNCTFTENRYTQSNAINNNLSNNVVINNCKFENILSTPAYYIYTNNSECNIYNSFFKSNFSTDAINSNNSKVYIDKCSIDSCKSAIINIKSDLNVYYSFILNCSTETGSIIYLEKCVPTINNCVIAKNYSLNGTINCKSADLSFYNCTIADNTASNHGAAVLAEKLDNYSASPTLYAFNSIFWNNNSTDATNATEMYFGDYANFILRDCCLTNDETTRSGSIGINSSVFENPQFTYNDKHPYAIYGSSPCVDRGVNLCDFLANDIRGEGYLRYLSKDGIADGKVDLGAYEYNVNYDPIMSVYDNSNSFDMSIYPEPVYESATLKINLDNNIYADISIVDIFGNEIRTIDNNLFLNLGENTIIFDANGLPSAVYYLLIKSNDNIAYKRFTVVR